MCVPSNGWPNEIYFKILNVANIMSVKANEQHGCAHAGPTIHSRRALHHKMIQRRCIVVLPNKSLLIYRQLG